MSTVFDRDTSCRKLFPEPFATPLLGLARMTKLPLHYLGEGLACPLARLGSAEDPYNLIPLQDKPKLRISSILWLGGHCLRREWAWRLHHLAVQALRRDLRNHCICQSPRPRFRLRQKQCFSLTKRL